MKVKEFQKKTFKILQNLRYFDTIFNVFSNHTSVYFFVDKQNDQVDFFCWSRDVWFADLLCFVHKFCIVFNTIFNVFSNHTSVYFFVDNFVLYSIQYLTFFRTIQACTFLLTNRKCVLFCWQTNKQTNRTTKLIFFAGLEKDPAFGRNHPQNLFAAVWCHIWVQNCI